MRIGPRYGEAVVVAQRAAFAQQEDHRFEPDLLASPVIGNRV